MHKENNTAHRHQHENCEACGHLLVERASEWMQNIPEGGMDFLPGMLYAGKSFSEGFSHLSRQPDGGRWARDFFDHIVLGKTWRIEEACNDLFDVVVMPNGKLPDKLRSSDVLLQRSLGEGRAWQAIAHTGELLSLEQAIDQGLSLNSVKPGFYLEMVVAQPVRRLPGEGYAKRVGDEGGRLLPNCLVLRAKGTDVEMYSENTPAVSKLLREEDASVVQEKTIYVEIPLGKRGLPNETGIFVPKGFSKDQPFHLLLYLHGMTGPCKGEKKIPPEHLWEYWDTQTMPHLNLRKMVNEALSGAMFAALHNPREPFLSNILLVAPFLGEQPKNAMGSRLVKDFDGYMSDVLAAFQQHYLKPGPGCKLAEPSSIILAAHSAGGEAQVAIAASSATYAKRISECWGFDSFYGWGAGDGVNSWWCWAKRHPNGRLYQYHHAGSPKINSEALNKKKLSNVFVEPVKPAEKPFIPQDFKVRDTHCLALFFRFQERLEMFAAKHIWSKSPTAGGTISSHISGRGPITSKTSGVAELFPFPEDVATLTGSVGKGGINKTPDVLTVQQRFAALGYDWVKQTGKADTDTVKAIRLFQSIVSGSKTFGGDGRIDLGGDTHRWLQSANAPRWKRLGQGQLAPKTMGFWNSTKQEGDDYGSDWLVNTIEEAGKIYFSQYLKANPNASVIYVNDLSVSQGIPDADHKTHQTGMAVDILLPRRDGISGKVTYNDCLYDLDAARAILLAFRSTPLFDFAYFNDPLLIKEKLCVKSDKSHDNHIHVRIKPPIISLLPAPTIPQLAPDIRRSYPESGVLRNFPEPEAQSDRFTFNDRPQKMK